MNASVPGSWQWLWRYVVGGGALALLGWRTFGADSPFLPLAMIELAFHESSHWATIWAPKVLYFMAGSIGQVLIPLAIGGYLWIVMHDPLGGALGIGWAGLSAHGVAVYVADAPHERLQLVGGNTHDWAYLLGPEQFDSIDSAAGLAALIDNIGIALVVLGVAICVVMPYLQHRRAELAARRAAGGVHWASERM